MAKLVNRHKRNLEQMSFKKNGNGYKLSLNFKRLGAKLDRAQYMLDMKVWDDVQKYMPVDSGELKAQTATINATQSGKVYLYPPESDYGHYQYEGVLYVDQLTGKGAFYSPGYGFWSRPKSKYGELAKKVLSDRLLTYSRPNATSHWGETAYDNHKDEWYKVVERVLKE